MRFLAVEHALPSKVVRNAEVLQHVADASAKHLTERDLKLLLRMTGQVLASAGTQVRYHRGCDETAFELACRAGRQALISSDTHPDEVDLLLYVGIGRGMLEPASATIFQDALELRHATCFDIIDACASWVRALQVVRSFLATKCYRKVMILNAEFMGREAYRYEVKSLDEFPYWHPSVTIGEAATATIVDSTALDDSEFSFRTWGDKRGLCFIPLPNFRNYFGMQSEEGVDVDHMQFVSYGRELMDFGARRLIEHYNSAGDFRSYKPDAVFIHSASDGVADFIRQQVGLPKEGFVLAHQKFANTVSATIPLALSDAIKSHAVADGSKILLLMASAGMTTALVKFTLQMPKAR